MDIQFKGIWIPREVWENTELNWNEKILLMQIDSFTSADRDCYFSNEYICDLLKVRDRQARECLYHLIDSGYVEVVRFDGRKRYIRSALKYQAGWQKTATQGGTIPPHNKQEEEININNNNNNNKGRSRFQKPTLEEVADYCRFRNNGIDPEAFYAYYESKGWTIGKSPMKDWKAAMVTWEKKEKEIKRTQPKPRQKESVYAHNLKVMDQMYGTHLYEEAYGRRQPDEQ